MSVRSVHTLARITYRITSHVSPRAIAVASLSLLGFFAAGPAAAQDRAEIDRTQIIGNRELPKVLYIVPWKKPTPGDLSGRPLTSVVDEALAPIDRDVFRRQVRYDAQVQAAQAEAAGAKAAPAPAAAPPAR